MFKKVGAETILTIMVLPFVIWVVTAVFELRAAYSDISTVKEDVKIIKTCLINGVCKE